MPPERAKGMFLYSKWSIINGLMMYVKQDVEDAFIHVVHLILSFFSECAFINGLF